MHSLITHYRAPICYQARTSPWDSVGSETGKDPALEWLTFYWERTDKPTSKGTSTVINGTEIRKSGWRAKGGGGRRGTDSTPSQQEEAMQTGECSRPREPQGPRPGGIWKQDPRSFHKGAWSQTGKQLQPSFSIGAGIKCLQLTVSSTAPAR